VIAYNHCTETNPTTLLYTNSASVCNALFADWEINILVSVRVILDKDRGRQDDIALNVNRVLRGNHISGADHAVVLDDDFRRAVFSRNDI
jgi:hypothetical protein